jgi:hypothetical protein
MDFWINPAEPKHPRRKGITGNLLPITSSKAKFPACLAEIISFCKIILSIISRTYNICTFLPKISEIGTVVALQGSRQLIHEAEGGSHEKEKDAR